MFQSQFEGHSQRQTLPVIAVVRKVLLWTQQQQLAVEHEEAAVVAHAAVHDGQAHIAHDAIREAVPYQCLRSPTGRTFLSRLRMVVGCFS